MYQQLPEAAREYIVGHDLQVHIIHVASAEAIPLPENDVVVSGIYHDGDEVLFVRSTKTGRDWELPTGRVEADESIEDALEREIREETGRVVNSFEPVGAIIWSFPEKPVVNLVFRTSLEGEAEAVHPEIDACAMFAELPQSVSFAPQAEPFYDQLLSDAVEAWDEPQKRRERILEAVSELTADRSKELAVGLAVSGAISLGVLSKRLRQSHDEPDE